MRALGLGLAAAIVSATALAHEAPMGWRYDYQCCSDNDCQQDKVKSIKEGGVGYTYTVTGETVPYGDKRIRRSQDEFFHICTVGGVPEGRILCIYEPNRGF